MASAFSLGLSFEWCWRVPAAWGLLVWTLCRGVVVAVGRNFRLLSVGRFWTLVNHFVRDKSKSLSSDPWLVQLLGASFLFFLSILETITKSQPRLHWVLQPSSSTSNFIPKFFMKNQNFITALFGMWCFVRRYVGQLSRGLQIVPLILNFILYEFDIYIY